MHAFTQHITHLRRQLAGSLPGTVAQFTMAPHYRRDASLADVQGKPCREAGVLALLFPKQDAPHILLTVRRADLKQHAGQVSFPGGRREPGEALHETALREAYEEVGLAPDAVELLGSLTPLYVPPSNFCVYPYVGLLPFTPSLHPQDDEVAELLCVPLAHLLRPETLRREDWTLRGRTINVPFFAVGSHKIWGATAMMLAELLALVQSQKDLHLSAL